MPMSIQPILSRKSFFRFREDIEVQWTHEWPIKAYRSFPVIYFIRDPRDSMHSRFKRESPDLSFSEFLSIPDAETLLHKIDNWVLFNRYWLQRKNLKVFRFEDYKQNASDTLASVLKYIGLKTEEEDFKNALFESTSDKARESESEYRKKNKEDREIINRSGTVSEWKKITDESDRQAILAIEAGSASLLKYFGYEFPVSSRQNDEAPYYPNVSMLPFFRQLEFSPKSILKDGSQDLSTTEYLSSFAARMSKEWIDRSGISLSETGVLLNSLLFFFRSRSDILLTDKIKKLLKDYQIPLAEMNQMQPAPSVKGKIKRILKKIIP